MPSTLYFPFFWERSGCLITKELRKPRLNAPSDFDITNSTIYNDWELSRIVDITKNIIDVDKTDVQYMEKYCLYLDRDYVGLVRKGDKVEFRRDQLGQNLAYINNQSENVIVAYINRIVLPQAQSIVGTVECYLVTNN